MINQVTNGRFVFVQKCQNMMKISFILSKKAYQKHFFLLLGMLKTERALFVQKMGIILENEVSLDSNQIFMVNFN